MNEEAIRELVYVAKPIFHNIIMEKGGLMVSEYFKESLLSPCLVSSERREELLSVVHDRLCEIISPDVAQRACEHLRQVYYASTADHHGPVGHPFFLNSHLAQAAANRRVGLNHVIVFAYGGVSLNNSSWPRSLLFHDRSLEERRLHFFSLRYRHHSVYGMPAFDPSVLSHMKQVASTAVETDHAKINEVLSEIYGSESMRKLSSFSDQMSAGNYHVWKLLPGEAQTELICLEIEDIVGTVLRRYHCDSNTLIHRLLFDTRFRRCFFENFKGIDGAWTESQSSGSFLFWLIKNNRRYALHEEDGELVSRESGDRITLTPEVIAQGLLDKTLLPGSALCSVVISLYYGLRCGGGFSQVNNLTAMKAAYEKMLVELEEIEPESWVQGIDTAYFCGEFVLATIAQKDRQELSADISAATGLDLVLYGNSETAARIATALDTTTLEVAVDQMMGAYYSIVTGLPGSYHSSYPVNEPTLYV